MSHSKVPLSDKDFDTYFDENSEESSEDKLPEKISVKNTEGSKYSKAQSLSIEASNKDGLNTEKERQKGKGRVVEKRQKPKSLNQEKIAAFSNNQSKGTNPKGTIQRKDKSLTQEAKNKTNTEKSKPKALSPTKPTSPTNPTNINNINDCEATDSHFTNIHNPTASANSAYPTSINSKCMKSNYKFISKLLEILSIPSISDIISWSPNGTTIEIKDQRRFTDEILPTHFKHNNYSNFIRQLNMYHFKKKKHYSDPHVIAYSNQYFLRDSTNLISEINRKTQGGPEKLQVFENESEQIIKDEFLANKLNSVFNRMMELETKVRSLTVVNENLISNNISFMEDIKDKTYYISMLERLIFYIVNNILPYHIVITPSQGEGVSANALAAGDSKELFNSNYEREDTDTKNLLFCKCSGAVFEEKEESEAEDQTDREKRVRFCPREIIRESLDRVEKNTRDKNSMGSFSSTKANVVDFGNSNIEAGVSGIYSFPIDTEEHNENTENSDKKIPLIKQEKSNPNHNDNHYPNQINKTASYYTKLINRLTEEKEKLINKPKSEIKNSSICKKCFLIIPDKTQELCESGFLSSGDKKPFRTFSPVISKNKFFSDPQINTKTSNNTFTKINTNASNTNTHPNAQNNASTGKNSFNINLNNSQNFNFIDEETFFKIILSRFKDYSKAKGNSLNNYSFNNFQSNFNRVFNPNSLGLPQLAPNETEDNAESNLLRSAQMNLLNTNVPNDPNNSNNQNKNPQSFRSQVSQQTTTVAEPQRMSDLPLNEGNPFLAPQTDSFSIRNMKYSSTRSLNFSSSFDNTHSSGRSFRNEYFNQLNNPKRFEENSGGIISSGQSGKDTEVVEENRGRDSGMFTGGKRKLI